MSAGKIDGTHYIVTMRAASGHDRLSLRPWIPKEHTPSALIVRIVWKNDSSLQVRTKPANLLGIDGVYTTSFRGSTGSRHGKCHARSECSLNEFPTISTVAYTHQAVHNRQTRYFKPSQFGGDSSDQWPVT